ncbi:MAG: AMP-binding protein [Solirubrobacterales bacterium]|nr:AMP-binding protein [Solirubrobacterales bacterium]
MNFIEDVLERFAAARPALLAIDRDGERRVWHFGELIAMSAGLSGALGARGVGRGDVVMTLVGNRLEWVLSMLACWRMGAVALPCNTQLRRKDLELRAGVAGPALCVGDEELLGELPDGIAYMTLGEVSAALDEDLPGATPMAVAELDPADPALIVFTSGTTGEPRAALHAQRYLPGQRSQAESWLGARDGDLVWCTTATGWSKSARNVFVAPWLCGAAAMIVDGRFEPPERLELIDRERVSVLCQAPTEYRVLAKRAGLRPLPSVRRAVSAGEALNPEVIAAWREGCGLEICDGYGQTETGHLTGNLVGDPLREGSMGRPLPGYELRIVEEREARDGEPEREAGPGEPEGDRRAGELQLRVESCPTFFARYLDGEPFAGEWWPTGDVVRRDEDGFLWYEGRNDDLILSAGYRIGPFEVESALLSHPAVAEAAAVSAPDAERGAIVRAIVVPRERGPSAGLARELQDHVKAVTAPYKYPRIVDFVETLPRTASGKVKRAQLRELGR